MYRVQRDPRPNITPGSTIGRVYSKLQNGRRTFAILVALAGTLTIATADATAILNRGSLAAAFNWIGASDNGRDFWLTDPRAAVVYSQLYAPSTQSAVRLTSTAQGSTNLVEYVMMYLSTPLQVDPGETAYVEAETNSDLLAFLDYKGNSTGAAAIATAGGGGTVTLSNVTATVIQKYDTNRGVDIPLLRPYVREYQVQVASAQAELPLYLRTTRFVRGLLIQQDSSGVGEVTDIVNSLRMESDARAIIGPSQIAFDDLQRVTEATFGGFSDTNGPGIGGSYAYIDLMEAGRLARVLDPAQDVNLRLLFNAQPSVTAGAGTSIIRVTSFELQRVPGVTAAELPWEAVKA